MVEYKRFIKAIMEIEELQDTHCTVVWGDGHGYNTLQLLRISDYQYETDGHFRNAILCRCGDCPLFTETEPLDDSTYCLGLGKRTNLKGTPALSEARTPCSTLALYYPKAES